jgi:hypothetical protein
MKRHVVTVLMSFAAAVISGAIFVVALFHQYALVEVAASILTGLQVFFLSAAIGDLLDEKTELNRARNSAVVLVTVFLVAFYSFTRYFH